MSTISDSPLAPIETTTPDITDVNKTRADAGMALPEAELIVHSTFDDPEFRKTIMAGVMLMKNENAQAAIRRFEAIIKHVAHG